LTPWRRKRTLARSIKKVVVAKVVTNLTHDQWNSLISKLFGDIIGFCIKCI